MNTDMTSPYYPAENPAAVEGLTMETVKKIYAEWKPAKEGNATCAQALAVQEYIAACTGWAFYILTFELMYNGSIIRVNPGDVLGFDPEFPLQYFCAAKSVPTAPVSGVMMNAGYFMTSMKNRQAEPLAMVTADFLKGYDFVYPIPNGPVSLVNVTSLWFEDNLRHAKSAAAAKMLRY